MTSPFAQKARAAGIVFITWLLSACGGGTDPVNTAQMDGAGAAQAAAATSTGEAGDAGQRERLQALVAALRRAPPGALGSPTA